MGIFFLLGIGIEFVGSNMKFVKLWWVKGYFFLMFVGEYKKFSGVLWLIKVSFFKV